MTRRSLTLSVATAAIVCSAAWPAEGSATVLGLKHVGPLRLGMTQTQAVGTGWLAHRERGCPLGGPPIPVTYRTDGRRAPRGLRGFAEFNGGRLTNLSFSKGVRTTLGVRVGVTTIKLMVSRYSHAGFRVTSSSSEIFGLTFVDVRRRGTGVLGAFASGSVISTLAIPNVQVCD